ncbi:hypothetical protein [Agromyces sp. NPDC058064]|uniref:hypothetical protein n=1 Tax=Agromyces sp. NPDC058064 TaxID=3346322 RepID=UPI0036D9947D
MEHDVSPPAWRLLVELINPLYWLGGAPTFPIVRRTLHVSVDEQGVLHYRTTGRVPAHWPRGDWEIEDGPALAAAPDPSRTD